MFILFLKYGNIYKNRKKLRITDMINSDKNSDFIYESKIESLFFLKEPALIFSKPAAAVYIALVLLFAFLEQGKIIK